MNSTFRFIKIKPAVKIPDYDNILDILPDEEITLFKRSILN